MMNAPAPAHAWNADHVLAGLAGLGVVTLVVLATKAATFVAEVTQLFPVDTDGRNSTPPLVVAVIVCTLSALYVWTTSSFLALARTTAVGDVDKQKTSPDSAAAANVGLTPSSAQKSRNRKKFGDKNTTSTPAGGGTTLRSRGGTNQKKPNIAPPLQLDDDHAQKEYSGSFDDSHETSSPCSEPDEDWSPPADKNQEVRIFMDGAFDLTHYGHYNALRLAKSLGNYLVVGVNSSDSVQKCKGFAPVLTDEERCIAVENCQFVDEIVPKSPYVMTKEYMISLIDSHKIDYFVHGSDPCLVDGVDVYEEARRMGRFRMVPRTKGISTTDIVGRMLLYGQTQQFGGDANNAADEMKEARKSSRSRTQTSEQDDMLRASAVVRSKSTASKSEEVEGEPPSIVDSVVTTSSDHRDRVEKVEQQQLSSSAKSSNVNKQARGRPRAVAATGGAAGAAASSSQYEGKNKSSAAKNSELLQLQSRFYSTTALLRAFSEHCEPPLPGQRVVYFPHSWDMYCATHILAMQEAKQQGDYLLIGVYSDALLNDVEDQPPILTFYERTLSVLGCSFTNDILLPAPPVVSEKFLQEFDISVVCVMDHATAQPTQLHQSIIDANLSVPVHKIRPKMELDKKAILTRVFENHEAFQTKYQKKIVTELAY
ncbi:unnamed protein product [Amoebophrya sp. A120]|nr:unnamed protein product [Amoebophrya sp. A120]|eukprot:GSA120T00019096001.1